jgi:hypothetical protein
MAQFRAFSPNVFVNGQTVLAVTKGMGSFANLASKILERHGIKDVDPMQWYPQQAWLDAFEEISKSVGPRTLDQIGMSIPESAKFPPGIDTVETALASIDIAYHLNHRGGEIGHYTFTKNGEKQGVMECGNPYPCEFDHGLIRAMTKRFASSGSSCKVSHDTSKPCRSNRGDSCTYLVTW